GFGPIADLRDVLLAGPKPHVITRGAVVLDQHEAHRAVREGEPRRSFVAVDLFEAEEFSNVLDRCRQIGDPKAHLGKRVVHTTCSFWGFARHVGGDAGSSETTWFSSVPMPSMSTVTTSSGSRKTGGSRRIPAPPGVPQTMTSPG